MKKRFDEYAFKYIDFASDDLVEKMMILSEIEDKSYFERKTTYNFLSREFVKYKINEKRMDYNGKMQKNRFSTRRVMKKINKE